jgi:16S rRNA processing protein RimM
VKDELVAIAKLVGFFGVKGYMKTALLTHSAARLRKARNVLVGLSGSSVIELQIQDVLEQSGSVLVKFKGIDDRNGVERFKNFYVYVRSENVVRPPKGSYLIDEILGAGVVTPAGEPRGTIVDVFRTAAQDVWTAEWNGLRYMIPAVPHFVKKVDIARRVITIEDADALIEGAKSDKPADEPETI